MDVHIQRLANGIVTILWAYLYIKNAITRKLRCRMRNTETGKQMVGS